jgi:peroxiredoxin
MIELVELEKQHAEFEKRNVRLVVISLEDQKTAEETQKEFPHLVVVADADRKLADAVKVIHENSSPNGGDTTAPTTILLDGNGTVRWLFRPDRFFTRLTPAQVLEAVDSKLADSGKK